MSYLGLPLLWFFVTRLLLVSLVFHRLLVRIWIILCVIRTMYLTYSHMRVLCHRYNVLLLPLLFLDRNLQFYLLSMGCGYMVVSWTLLLLHMFFLNGLLFPPQSFADPLLFNCLSWFGWLEDFLDYLLLLKTFILVSGTLCCFYDHFSAQLVCPLFCCIQICYVILLYIAVLLSFPLCIYILFHCVLVLLVVRLVHCLFRGI